MKRLGSAILAAMLATPAASQDVEPSSDAFSRSLECAAVLGLRWTDAKDPGQLVPQAARETQAKAAFEEAVMLGEPLGYNRNQVAAQYFQIIHRHVAALMAGSETDEEIDRQGDACAGGAATGSI